MKKLIISLILMFSLSFFCACSYDLGMQTKNKESTIESSLSFFPSGQILQEIKIGVNSEWINKNVGQKENLVFIEKLVSEVENLRQRYVLNFAITYLKNPIETHQIGRGVKVAQTAYNQGEDCVGFGMIFSSQEDWNYYHNQPQNKGENGEGLPFLKKKKSSSIFPFASKLEDGGFSGQMYINLYQNAAKGMSLEEKIAVSYNPTFIYKYCTYFAQLKSNADEKFQDKNGFFCHVWKCKEEDFSRKNEVVLYYYIANKGLWILFATTLPSGVLTAYLIVIKIKKKRKGRGN